MRAKTIEEAVARRLCRLAGNPEDTTFEGRPMWMSYMQEAEAVLATIRDFYATPYGAKPTTE